MAERLKVEIRPDNMTPGPPSSEWQVTGEQPLSPEWKVTEEKPVAVEGKQWNEIQRAIAKADRDYIVPMLGLPADIVGWAFDTKNDLPGSTAWWKSLPGISGVPEPKTRAGKLGAEVLGQGATGLVEGGVLGKGVQVGGQFLGSVGRQVASKVGGQIADPTSNVASALGSAAAGQSLESIVPEGFEPLAHGVGSVLGGAVGGGFTAPTRAASAVDKAFEAYKRLGLSPSASMVGVGGRTAELLEGNVLPSALGSAGRMHRFATETKDKFQSIKDNIASQFGAARTKYDMGKDVQETVAKGFKARKQEGADILETVGQAFGPNDRFIPKNLNKAIFKPVGSGDTLAVQKYATDPEIGEIKALLDNTSGALTYADMLAIKSKLGNKLEQSHALPVDKAQISQLVAAIDNDMKAVVESIGNPDTVRDWERGKAIYNNAMRDYERAFKELLGKKDVPINPEKVYDILLGHASTKSSADIEDFELVWRQLGKQKQGELASTVLTRMGNIDPEKAGSVDGFSLPTFLTNYKNLSPAAKNLLFRSTGNQQLEQALDDLMFAANKIGGWDKVASTSRSQISGTMLGQVGAIAGIAATADWLTALKFAVLDIGGPAAAAWTLTNPKGIRAIANALEKANDSAVGAMRGVMAINPPRGMPGRDIPSGAPQKNPQGGSHVPGRQSSLPGQVLSDASPDPVRPGAQYAANEPQSVLPQARPPSADPSFLSDAEQAAEARGAAAQRQRQAVQPAEGRQEGEATESLLDLAIPGRSALRSATEGEYGQAAIEAGLSAVPYGGKALSTAARAAPAITKTAGAAVAALTSLFTDSSTGKVQLSKEQQQELRLEQEKAKARQKEREIEAAAKKQEANDKADRDAKAAETAAKTQADLEERLAKIKADNEREQLIIKQEAEAAERKAAEDAVKSAAEMNKLMHERPFREQHPDAALNMMLGGLAVSAMIPGAGQAYKKWAFNSYVKDWEKLDKAASKALLEGSAEEQQLAVNKLAAAAAEKAEREGKLHKYPWISVLAAPGLAVEASLIPQEIDASQPYGSRAYEENAPPPVSRILAIGGGGILGAAGGHKLVDAAIRERKLPTGTAGTVKTFEEKQIARKSENEAAIKALEELKKKKAEATAKGLETKAKKKAEAAKESRKAKVPRGGPKVYGLREEE